MATAVMRPIPRLPRLDARCGSPARRCAARRRAWPCGAAEARPASRSTASPCTASRRCRPDFTHLRYVNPAAPKGGRLTQGVLGTFDSLNPFIVKGLAPSQIRGYVIESLLARGYDEPFTLYGLLARTVETDAERSYVTFTLDPGREILRRQAGDRRRRDLFLAAPARQGPAELPHLLRQGRQGRGAVASARCASISPAPTTANCR